MKPQFYLKIARNLALVAFLLCGNSAFAQRTISPNDSTLNTAYFKNQSLFHKLTWLDSNGNITREATLNLVTRIDTVNHTMTYLQIRNDGKKDSSICEYPSLKPIFVSSVNGSDIFRYDYRGGNKVQVYIAVKDKPLYDTVFTMPKPYFDGFLAEYLLGALPLEKMQPLQFDIYRGDTKMNGTTVISKIHQDVLPTSTGKYTPVYVLTMVARTSEYLVYVDVQTRTVLKSVSPLPNGGFFVKARM